MNNLPSNNGLPEFNEKTKIMLGLLSEKRQKDLLLSITKSIQDIQNDSAIKDKLKESILYPMEMTQRFEDEEPKQFIYIEFYLSIIDIPKGVDYPYPFGKILSVPIKDMEVYDISKLDFFMDIVSRIDKFGKSGNNIYYSNNVLKDGEKNDNYKQLLISQPVGNASMDSNGNFSFKKFGNKNNNTNVNDAFTKALDGFETEQEEEEEEETLSLIYGIAENKYYEDIQFVDFKKTEQIDFMLLQPRITNKELHAFKNTTKMDSSYYLNKFYEISSKMLNYSMERVYSNKPYHEENEITLAFTAILSEDIIDVFYKCDFFNLPNDVLEKMGFTKYNKSYLIPVWALNVIFLNSIDKWLVDVKTGRQYHIKDARNSTSIKLSIINGCCNLGIPKGVNTFKKITE